MKSIKKYYNNFIGPLQYMVLVVFLSRSFFIGIGYSNILIKSKNDTWFIVLISIILGLIPIFIIRFLNKYNINLFELIKSKIIKYIIILLVLFSFTILFNDLVNFINLKYLFNTSKIFISILLILPIIYIVNKDIESIGRSSLFIFYLSVILYIIISISLIKYIDINNLKPIFKTNINDLISSILRFISYLITPIIFLNIIPKNKDYKEYNKYLLVGYIMSSISSLIIIFFITTTYNFEFISKFNYPEYIVLQKIEYGFISNPANILSFFFIIDYFYSLIIYMYIIKYYLEEELKLKDKILNITYYIIIILLVYSSIYLFENIKIINILSKDLLFYIFIIFLGLFITILPTIKRVKN